MYKITNSGWLEVITGAMMSGKTEELLRRVRRVELANQKFIAFKPSLDSRYESNKICSHNDSSLPCKVIKKDKPENIANHVYEEIDVIAIDEAQFFDIKLVNVIERFCVANKRVIVAGLDTDFRGEPFLVMAELLAKAEYVDKIKGICSICGELSTKTQRYVDGDIAHYDDDIIKVGGTEMYEGVCRSCHRVRRD